MDLEDLRRRGSRRGTREGRLGGVGSRGPQSGKNVRLGGRGNGNQMRRKEKGTQGRRARKRERYRARKRRRRDGGHWGYRVKCFEETT